jgi:hypothetical protein
MRISAFARLVALLLVPALMADPVMAAGIYSTTAWGSNHVIGAPGCFNSEALGGALTTFRKLLTSHPALIGGLYEQLVQSNLAVSSRKLNKKRPRSVQTQKLQKHALAGLASFLLLTAGRLWTHGIHIPDRLDDAFIFGIVASFCVFLSLQVSVLMHQWGKADIINRKWKSKPFRSNFLNRFTNLFAWGGLLLVLTFSGPMPILYFTSSGLFVAGALANWLEYKAGGVNDFIQVNTAKGIIGFSMGDVLLLAGLGSLIFELNSSDIQDLIQKGGIARWIWAGMFLVISLGLGIKLVRWLFHATIKPSGRSAAAPEIQTAFDFVSTPNTLSARDVASEMRALPNTRTDKVQLMRQMVGNMVAMSVRHHQTEILRKIAVAYQFVVAWALQNHVASGEIGLKDFKGKQASRIKFIAAIEKVVQKLKMDGERL